MQIIHIPALVEQIPVVFSPSRVNFVLKCPLRGLYDHACNRAYRNVGNSAYASLGNVIHNVFKASSEKKLQAPTNFDAVWEFYEQKEGGVNLKAAVPNYGKLKFFTRNQIANFSAPRTIVKSAGAYVLPERKIIDDDLGLQGQPDLIVFRNFKPYEIKDYKTGKVFETDIDLIEDDLDFENLKLDYKNQLYLYAYLVNTKFGSYPDYLTIVQPDGYEIQAPCDNYAIASLILDLKNCKNDLAVKPARGLAVPSAENCRYCPFKPGCRWHHVRNDEVLKDISGVVKSASVHAYGNFSIELQSGEKFFHKTPASDIIRDIYSLVGKEIFMTAVREEIPEKRLFTPVKNSILYIKDLGK